MTGWRHRSLAADLSSCKKQGVQWGEAGGAMRGSRASLGTRKEKERSKEKPRNLQKLLTSGALN